MSPTNPEHRNPAGVTSDPDRPPLSGPCPPDEASFNPATGNTVEDQVRRANLAWQKAAEDAARQPPSLPPSSATSQGSLEGGVKGMVQEKQRELQDHTREAWGRLRQQGQERMESQKERLAEGLVQIRDAARAAADQLRQENREMAASYSEALASQLERSADYLRQRDVKQISREIRDWGRSRPGLVVGSLFFAGLAISRFLKASEAQQDPYRPEEGQQTTPPRSSSPSPFLDRPVESGMGENFGESPTHDEPLGSANPQAGTRSAGGGHV